MILWEITSYRRALELEAGRRAEIARLEMAHGRRWRRHAPADERLAIKLAGVAPAELLPSLTATITPAAGRPESGTRPAPAARPEPATAPEPSPPGPQPGSLPGPLAELQPVEPKIDQLPDPEPDASTRTASSARQRAAALLATEPDIPGTELARRLGVTTGYGRRLRSELLNSANGYR
jgi:hypothetical protein